MYRDDLDAAITENEVLRAENRELNNKYEALRVEKEVVEKDTKVEKKENRFKKIVEFLGDNWGKFSFGIFVVVMIAIYYSADECEK